MYRPATHPTRRRFSRRTTPSAIGLSLSGAALLGPAIALAIALAAGAPSLSAQDGPTRRHHSPSDLELANAAYLPTDVYIRVSLTNGDPRFGHLVSVDPSGVVLRDGAGRITSVPVNEVRRLDVLTGRERGGGDTFLKTMLFTGAIGGTVGAAIYKPCVSTGWMSCMFAPSSHAGAFAQGAALSGILLGVPFGILAALNERDVWERVRLPGPTARGARFHLAPTPGGGVRTSVSIAIGARR